MSKQRSHLRLEGTLGETTYYKGKDGEYNVKLKSGISKSTIMNSPKFAILRATMAETTELAKITKNLYNGIVNATRYIGGNQPFLILRSALKEVQRQDTATEYGKRKTETALMVPENRSLLKNLDFNPAAELAKLLPNGYTTDISKGTVQIDKVVTDDRLVRPLEAHKLGFNAIRVNVIPSDNGGFTTTQFFAPEVVIDIDNNDHNITLDTGGAVPAEGFSILCVFLRFYKVADKFTLPLANSKYTAAGIVDIS